MALFLTNICKFEGCGIIFRSLPALIDHIESTHIDFDPEVIQQLEMEQPECLPMSYVLPYCNEDTGRNVSCLSPSSSSIEKNIALQHHNYSISLLNSVSGGGGGGSDSDIDDYEYSATEWQDTEHGELTSNEDFSTEFIMRYYSVTESSGGDEKNDKPFACPVPGCKKRYKNINGIKYHAKNGHKKNPKTNKFYRCHCGKIYKTAHGLKNHVLTLHYNSEIILPSTSTNPQSLDLLSLANMGHLQSNFERFYDSNSDDGIFEDNMNDSSSSAYMQNTDERQAELMDVSLSPVLAEMNNYEEPPKPPIYDKSLSATVPIYPSDYEQNEEIIDVGDVNDCVYAYN